MWNSFLWGLFATSSLILGGIIGIAVNFRQKAPGYHYGFWRRYLDFRCFL